MGIMMWVWWKMGEALYKCLVIFWLTCAWGRSCPSGLWIVQRTFPNEKEREQEDETQDW